MKKLIFLKTLGLSLAALTVPASASIKDADHYLNRLKQELKDYPQIELKELPEGGLLSLEKVKKINVISNDIQYNEFLFSMKRLIEETNTKYGTVFHSYYYSINAGFFFIIHQFEYAVLDLFERIRTECSS